MARTKNKEDEIINEENDIKEENKSEELIDKEKEELVNTINNQKEELSSLKEQMEMIQNMLKNMNQQPQIIQKNVNDEMITIISCLHGRHILVDMNHNEVVTLLDRNKPVTVSLKRAENLMTETNRRLFEDGLITFTDNKWYDYFGLSTDKIITEEKLKEIYQLPMDKLTRKLDEITNYGKNDRVKYTLIWTIVRNIAENKEGFVDRGKELQIENYFKVNIQNCIKLLNYAENEGFYN